MILAYCHCDREWDHEVYQKRLGLSTADLLKQERCCITCWVDGPPSKAEREKLYSVAEDL